MQWLDSFSSLIGLILAIPVFWTWWDVVFGKRRRERRWFHESRNNAGSRPGILILDLLAGKHIRTDVERYRSSNKALRSIPDEHIFIISRKSALHPDDMPDLIREIHEMAGQIHAAGLDTLHFFYAGPSVAAALVGAEFANACRVQLYQHHPGGDYENYGAMRAPLREIA